MTKRIPLSEPVLDGEELRYLAECVRTNWVSYSGPFVTTFERRFARTIGMPDAVALNSGTAALHLALLIAGVGPGDLVIVPDLTFIAPANAVRYCGAEPAFVDVTADTWTLDVEMLDAFLREHPERARVKAVLPVHLLGHPADMDPLLRLCARAGVAVVEDATESLGARYRGRHLGTLGAVGCFSFNGNKIITSGGGGMLVAASAADMERARYLSTQARDDPAEYVHDAVGFNYRLSNVHAAVGIAQLERLDARVAAKRRIAERYRAGLADVPGVSHPLEAPWATATFWLYTILVAPPAKRASRELIADLAREGIEARPLWAPLHQQRPYRENIAYRIERAPDVYARAVSLPSSVDLSEEDQDRVISAVRRSLAP